MSPRPSAKRLINEELSAQQRAVLQMAWDGLDVKETAQALGLSWNTVRNYRASIYMKWGVRNVEGMLRQGVERGVIHASWRGQSDCSGEVR